MANAKASAAPAATPAPQGATKAKATKAKATPKAKAQAAPQAAPTAPQATPKAPAGPTIQVQAEQAAKANYRGARAAWLAAMQAWDGKPVADAVKALAAEPPTKPKTGKYAGTGEPPLGWVRFFVRQGVIKLIS